VTETSGIEPPRATIRDVARVAGVAPSTVSRALSRPGQVSSSTARRIREVAAELGYRTDPLVTESTDTLTGLIAILVPDLGNPFFAGLIKGVQGEAERAGFGLLVSDADETASVERGAVRRLASVVDGFLLASSRMSETAVRKTAETRPTVLVNRLVRGVPGAIFDLRPGIQDACRHIRELGHESVTFLDGPEASWTAGVRWHELTRACADNRMTLHRCGPNAPTFEGGIAAEEQYRKFRSTAVVAYNDLMAMGFIAALRERGIAVPEEVSVVGIDDIPLGALVTPALSSIRQPHTEIGAMSARMLIDRIRLRPDIDSKVVVAATRFISRASTARRVRL
jgi:DNA-binding LacI/PurR family transcriptional regulator